MKRVCVIGAGASGLPAIKSCIEEGLDVTCYEQSQYIGGLWRYREEVQEDEASVFKCVVQNVSKESMAYSDFPPPAEYPVYLRNHLYYEYLQSYCDRFNLKKYIKFHKKVLEVAKADDYESTGQWKIVVCEIENKEHRVVEYFDFVLVCSGHHIRPTVPVFPGQSEFKGQVLHSKEYKRPEPFREKIVVVVGFGNSATDIATDIGPTTKQTYLSTRQHCWIFPRYLEGKKILDHELFRRSFQLWFSFLPISFLLSKYESMINKVFDHKFCGLNPAHRIASQRPLVNDVIFLQLLNGTIQIKPGIKELRPTGVIFEGEEEVTEADVVLYGTGFKPTYTFLKGMEDANEYTDKMYRLVFPAHLQHQTLAFIGHVDPNLSSAVCAELQSRWVTRIFSGKLNLPPRTHMLEKAYQYQEMLQKTCYNGFSQKTSINGPPYLEEIAKDLGVRPNLLRILITDPELFLAVFFGPLCSYQYRIHGPHSWSGAREAILGLEERACFAMKDKTVTQDHCESSRKRFLKSTLLSVGVAVSLVFMLKCFGFFF